MKFSLFMHRFPIELLMHCLKHMPIVDLARMMGTSRIFRQLAGQEIIRQVDVMLENAVKDGKEFRQLLKVRQSYSNILRLLADMMVSAMELLSQGHSFYGFSIVLDTGRQET